jgi:hypothetical protein
MATTASLCALARSFAAEFSTHAMLRFIQHPSSHSLSLTPPAGPLPCRLRTLSAVTQSLQRSSDVDAVVREFHEALARSSDMAVAVAAIQALTTVIKNSTSTTMMGLERELKDAAASLQNCNPTAISLKAGCELFLRCVLAVAMCLCGKCPCPVLNLTTLRGQAPCHAAHTSQASCFIGASFPRTLRRYTTRTSAIEADTFAAAKKRLIERGQHFAGGLEARLASGRGCLPNSHAVPAAPAGELVHTRKEGIPIASHTAAIQAGCDCIQAAACCSSSFLLAYLQKPPSGRGPR